MSDFVESQFPPTPFSLDDVSRAATRLEGIARRTPAITSRTLDELTGARVRLKAECFQRTGSFKFRGAYNAVTAIDPSVRANGVVTFSSGNHGQAVARSAALHDVPAVVVMPTDAPQIKLRATAGYGAEVITYDRYTESREEIGDRLSAERGLTLIPPFNHHDVMAGQGTLALELFEDEPVDVMVVCVGGGGLISGCSTVAKSHGDVRVVGVEPVAGDDVKQSLEAGELVSIAPFLSIADGQQTTSAGPLTFAVIKDRVDEIVLVSDEEIIAAMRFAFERLNIVLEPSGASAFAALLAGKIDVAGQRVGVTLSGGNVDLARFHELTAARPD